MIATTHPRATLIVASFALLLIALSIAPRQVAAEVVDRIIATVNGHVILQSDLDEALCYEAFLTNRNLSQFTDDDRRTVLDRLIDQELLREQVKSADFPHATDAEVNARLAEARKQYPQASSQTASQTESQTESNDAWLALLAQYHLAEKDLLTHIRQQIDLMRLVDARLRPSVQIDSKSIETYYRDQFVPRLKQSGVSEVPLAEVSAKIRELLTQEKVSELLVSWLQTLRSEGQVHIPGTPSSANDPGVESR